MKPSFNNNTNVQHKYCAGEQMAPTLHSRFILMGHHQTDDSLQMTYDLLSLWKQDYLYWMGIAFGSVQNRDETYKYNIHDLNELIFEFNDSETIQCINTSITTSDGNKILIECGGLSDGDNDPEGSILLVVSKFSISNIAIPLLYCNLDASEKDNNIGNDNDIENNASFDTRSDDEGAKPESIIIGECCNGDTYVFIGLERVGGIMIYGITANDMVKIYFVEYINNRDFNIDYIYKIRHSEYIGDIEPKTLIFMTDNDINNGIACLFVAYELDAE